MEFRRMSPEEIERTVQFLLNQQAQFAVDFERLSGKTEQIADGLIGLTSIVGRVADRVADLTASQQRTDAQLQATDAQLRETDARLSDHLRSIGSHMDVLIQTVERHLRADHGGAPG